MQPNDLIKISLQIEALFEEMQVRVMQDIVRRILKAGKITSTADYQIEKKILLGNSTEFIEAEIKRLTEKTQEQIWQMYEDVIDWEYVRNKGIYEQINGHFIPYEDNEQLQQWVYAIYEQTNNEIKNITRSMGFALNYAGRVVFTPFSEYYQKYLDRACMDVVTGVFDYNTVLRRVVKELTASGIRTVDYASGCSNRVTVAGRRAVMTGVNQLSAKINEKVAKDLGTDTFEVTWHAGARPTHWWGGMVFTKKELENICGLGSVDGLCGANCRHNYMAFVPGVSVRTYTDEQLAEMNHQERQTKEWKDKKYTTYEATQKQRKMETSMRAQRERIKLLQDGKADKDTIMLEKAKYQGQLNEYAKFCKKMGLPQERERIYLDGFGKVATNTKWQNMKYTSEMIRNARKDSKQYEKYKEVLGNSVGTLADFRQMKYNKPREFELLTKKFDTYSAINKKNWSEEFKQKSKDAYVRFEKEGIYLSDHALSRLPRLNKKGFLEISENDVKKVLKGNPNYKEGETKLVYFSEELQLSVIKNIETGDIVSIIRAKKPKGDWENV
ncbi:hypothetical protein HMPREF9477_00909 [Lachnospiraceae bacterium 2_1_46FAA]|jgi:hypothetical protein|nr:hypothetical protein HMPREF9477_00909 [Lachnospiraceae bacterium 2_1_46FAA]